MRFIGIVNGFSSDFKNNDLFRKTKLQVNYTSDHYGKTLSIGDTERGIQFSIPFDGILKEIMKGDHL